MGFTAGEWYHAGRSYVFDGSPGSAGPGPRASTQVTMMATTTLLTAADLLELPDDGVRHDLIHGELTRMNPAGFEHLDLSRLLIDRLRGFASERDLGVVGGEAGFILAHDPDTVLAPDIVFVRADPLPPRDRQGFLAISRSRFSRHPIEPSMSTPRSSSTLTLVSAWSGSSIHVAIPSPPTRPTAPPACWSRKMISTAARSCPASGCR